MSVSLIDLNAPEAGNGTEAIASAATALSSGDLVVLPTDTVYGVAAEAFSPASVEKLLNAKGRDRTMPPPVLVASKAVLDALTVDAGEDVHGWVERFWPGPLTIICKAQPMIAWDLGETRGTVALRMPDHPVALELLRVTGPLAVSSANLTGQPAALTAADAQVQLGDSVAVYLEAGQANLGEPSTIIDATQTPPRVVRLGALSLKQLREVAPVSAPVGHPEEALAAAEAAQAEVGGAAKEAEGASAGDAAVSTDTAGPTDTATTTTPRRAHGRRARTLVPEGSDSAPTETIESA
ncbi:threonylcarbamoyl-AMP synthase [Micrococcales bacterium 31B]|nr:threonylcarbamoyl-AMP synthase [Micrococcales bacterium 31B]